MPEVKKKSVQNDFNKIEAVPTLIHLMDPPNDSISAQNKGLTPKESKKWLIDHGFRIVKTDNGYHLQRSVSSTSKAADWIFDIKLFDNSRSSLSINYNFTVSIDRDGNLRVSGGDTPLYELAPW